MPEDTFRVGKAEDLNHGAAEQEATKARQAADEAAQAEIAANAKEAAKKANETPSDTGLVTEDDLDVLRTK